MVEIFQDNGSDRIARRRLAQPYGCMGIAEKLAKLVNNQSEISRMTGLAQSLISGALARKRRLYVDQAFAIARAIGVSLDYLADDASVDPPAPELSDDERSVIDLYRALGLDRAEGLRRLAGAPCPARKSDHPGVAGVQVLPAHRDSKSKAPGEHGRTKGNRSPPGRR